MLVLLLHLRHYRFELWNKFCCKEESKEMVWKQVTPILKSLALHAHSCVCHSYSSVSLFTPSLPLYDLIHFVLHPFCCTRGKALVRKPWPHKETFFSPLRSSYLYRHLKRKLWRKSDKTDSQRHSLDNKRLWQWNSCHSYTLGKPMQERPEHLRQQQL